ncbi:MAG TPA: permease prefix domain 1-containing protein [Thermoguttaceae bacterium]
MTGGMSPEEFQNYLGLLSRLLRLRAIEREEIAEELRCHLEERLAVLTAQGIEPTRAVSMALAEFGDAAALAAEFTAVSQIYKRRWIMRLTVGSIVASLIAVVVLFAYWPGAGVHMNQAVAEAEKAQQTPVPNPEMLDANAQTQAKLEKLIDADFVETPLVHVLDYLADVTKVQYHLDNKHLSDVGITSDVPITFHLKYVPAEMVLRLILRELNLTYWLDNGVVIVSTPDEADSRLEIRVYRVDDLLDCPSMAKNDDLTDSSAKKQKRVSYDHLIDVITSTIHPTTWDNVGGQGSIAPYRGTLVISQTADVHREIKKVLDDLKKSINKDFEDENSSQYRKSKGKEDNVSGGGSVGGMGLMGSKKKEENTDKTQPTSDKQN